ncbi:MAG: PLDc N-terminal domain-containing protein [Terrimesophilobacter sp.]
MATLVISALALALFITALIDLITIEGSRIRYLDKFFWIVIVILLPGVGSILWFVIGREYVQPVPRASFGSPGRWQAPSGTSISDTPPASATEAELAALEREIAADRIRKLESELREKRRAKGIEE